MTLDYIYSVITILAIIGAGAWALYKFDISRERFPKLQFNLSMHQLGHSRDKRILEFVAMISNKGIARQYIRNFTFNVLTFDDTQPFDVSDPKIEKRLRFTEVSKGLNWVNSKHPAFVDGGISQEFTYVTAVEEQVKFVMIYSKFDHDHKKWFGKQTTEHYRIAKTFAV